MNIKQLFFLLSLVGLTACSSDDDGSTSNTGLQSHGGGAPITIAVSSSSLSDSGGAGTRAAITYKETLEKFYMHYLTESPKTYNSSVATSVTDKDRKWQTTAQWPSIDADVPCYFFAYANVDYDGQDYSGFNYNKDSNYKPSGQSLDFSIDELTNGQMDLLVSTQVMSQSENDADHPVHFRFKHVCSALQFSICKTAALQDFDIKLSEVKLCNIKKDGTYHFSDSTWTNNLDGTDPYADYTLASYSGTSTVTVHGEDSPTLLANNANDYMFVIPQTVVPWNNSVDIASNNSSESPQSYLRIKCRIVKGSKNYSDGEYVYLPFGDTWKRGYIHRYNIKMGTGLKSASGALINFNN